MSLIKCPECGKVFSDRAAHCPHCGLPIEDALKDIAAQNGGVVPTVELENSGDTGNSAAAVGAGFAGSPKFAASARILGCFNTRPNTGNINDPATSSSATEPAATNNPSAEYTRQDYDHIPSSMPTPPQKPGRQGSLMMYILIVAVVVLAIVCIAMIANSGNGSGDFGSDDDSIGTITTLPADTQPQQTQMMEDIQPEPVRAAEEPEPVFNEEGEEPATAGEATTPAEPNAASPTAPASTSTPAQPQHTPAQSSDD